ncbi:universal stress protein [Dokdonia ponticola]|uniref:Universal stress protein n=1 Tax=Dokdonia ponticola TaxID=2041041 RepID=A0ABV9HTK4_9FLAO
MKNILIPVDFSEVSWNALHCALCFFENVAIQFYIIHVNTHTNGHIVDDGDLEIHKNIAIHTRFKEWLKISNKQITAHHKISSLERKGSFIKTLREVVTEKNIDLIVLGTQQSNVFEDSVIGSYTREVITRVKCPALVVPQDTPCPVPKEMALLTDFNFKHNSKALKVISDMVTIGNAHLTILNLLKKNGIVSIDQKENKQFLKEAFSNLDHSFHFVVNQTMDEALQFFIDVQQVDLVILFAKNMNFSEHLLFSPSTDTTINYHKKTPFLIVHE